MTDGLKVCVCQVIELAGRLKLPSITHRSEALSNKRSCQINHD